MNLLNSFGADKVVAIAEDAMRVIARANYDYESNRVVGFVLPCDSNGLPKVDTYLATSFAAVENMFQPAKPNGGNNAFCPLSNYICTLPSIETIESRCN